MSLCGYRKLQADRARSRWFIGLTYRVTQWADEGVRQSGNVAGRVLYTAAKYAVLLFAAIVNTFWLLGAQVMWLMCRMTARDRPKPERIKHVFILMLENRSFDHMLGFSGIQGIDAITGEPTAIEGADPARDWNLDPQGNKVPVFTPAKWAMDYDPGHEFPNVKTQLCGVKGEYPHIDNSGFVADFARLNPANAGEIMQCYAPEQVPVITTLAREFAVCDHWFSSLPGPTWPNRFFVHAASSGGLDHSPNLLEEMGVPYSFANGTIFDLLDNAKLDWEAYMGDEFPQVLHMDGMMEKFAEGKFKSYDNFAADLKDTSFSKSYVFIEPDWHPFTKFKGGNSQHPLDDVTRGELLIKNTYEAIRNSPVWERSLLIITYDEHGGFYDHVAPPTTVEPGDEVTSPFNNKYGFNFRQLGVRVPAVVVSPYIAKGTIDHRIYDHSSIPATIEALFNLPSLTQRDRNASRIDDLLTLENPRDDAPETLPSQADSKERFDFLGRLETGLERVLSDLGIKDTQPVDPSLAGFVHIALLRKLSVLPSEERGNEISEARNLRTEADAARYIYRARSNLIGR